MQEQCKLSAVANPPLHFRSRRNLATFTFLLSDFLSLCAPVCENRTARPAHAPGRFYVFLLCGEHEPSRGCRREARQLPRIFAVPGPASARAAVARQDRFVGARAGDVAGGPSSGGGTGGPQRGSASGLAAADARLQSGGRGSQAASAEARRAWGTFAAAGAR